MKSQVKIVNKVSVRKLIFQELCRSWWVFLMLILIAMLYAKTHQLKNDKIQKLASRLNELEEEKLIASATKDQLLLEVASLNDPDYIEMLLIKNMGVIPEDAIKVRFKTQEYGIASISH